MESFSINEQIFEDNKLTVNMDLLFGFKITSKECSLSFINDIANRNLEFPVKSEINVKNQSEKSSLVNIILRDYEFDKSLNFDQLTNFSCLLLRVKGRGEFSIPVFCGIVDQGELCIKVLSPI